MSLYGLHFDDLSILQIKQKHKDYISPKVLKLGGIKLRGGEGWGRETPP